MTDPLSAASGIAGLISLADIIFIKLVQLRKLWKSAKKAEDDAQILMTQISVLGGTLKRANMLADALGDEPYDSSVRLTAVEACYQSLSDIRNKLNAALDKMKSNSGRQRLVEKVKFVFSTDEMTELLVNLSRHQDTFQLAIAADSMSGIIQCLSRGEGVKQQVEEVATDVKRVLDICVRVDMSTRKKNIIEFFMKESPGQAFQTSLKLRHPLTGLWIQRCPEYQCWLKGSTTSLWLAGMMGAGKTVLVGTVIEDALQLSSDRVAVSYFYCDYKKPATRLALTMISALTMQVGLQNPEAFKALEDYHNTLHPSTGILQTSTSEELLAVLEKMSAVLDRIIIVVDGIDEGEKVDEILSILTKISKLCRVSLAVSSRDEVQIREALVEFDELQISATNDDVRLFVMGEMETRIQSRKLRNVGTKMKEEIVDTLITKARGMFRWVACQLDYLCELSTDRQRREAMKSLPPTLPETYIRILERIPPSQSRCVSITLRLLSQVSSISIACISDAVSAEKGVYLNAETRIPGDEAVRACSSLVRKTGQAGAYLEISHASVQQFLTGDALLNNPRLADYRLSPEQDNRTLALACLNYLQVANFERLVCGDETILFDSELPFHRYAILNWARHAANHLEDDEVFGLMKTLFDPARSAPPNYAWKLNMLRAFSVYLPPAKLQTESIIVPKYLFEDGFTSLHMASLLSLPNLCQFLAHSGDMSRYGDDKTSISVPSPFELAAIGPEMICTGIYDSPSRELPQDQALWNSKFDSFGITTVRVLDTLQTLRASGMEDTKPPFPRLDHTLNTVIHRAVYLDPSYIIVAVRVILSTVAAVDVSKLPETPLAADSMEWFIRERVWVKYGMQLTYKVDYESLLREAILQLNPLTSEAPFIGRLCYACWEMALSWRLAFTLDPCFVSTAISIPQESDFIEAAFKAAEGGNHLFLKHLLQDTRLDIRESRVSGLTLLETCIKGSESVEVVQLLLNSGSVVSPEGRKTQSSPMNEWAGRAWINPLHQRQVFGLLKAGGASTTAVAADGNTAWHRACSNLSALEVMVSAEQPGRIPHILTLTNGAGWTPLMESLNSSEICALYLLSFVSPESQDCFQGPESPYVLAAQLGSDAVLNRLVELGVETRLSVGSDDENKCPLHYIGPTATTTCIRGLGSVFKGSCISRCNTDSHLESFFKACVLRTTNGEHNPTIPDEEVVTEIINGLSLDLANVWKCASRLVAHLSTLHIKHLGVLQALREVIATLVRLDTLEAFENANETCAVFSLLEPLPFWSDEGGRNKAMGAIQNKDIIYPLEASILKKLLQMTKYLDNFISSDAAILLHYASILGIRYLAHAEDLVRYLLASGLDVHRRAGRYSPLEVACLAISESADLCDAFASVLSAERLGEANPTEGMAAFHYATLVHRAEVTPMMKALLNCGANVNAPVVKSGVTPLMAAVSLKSVSGAIWLLQHGADPTVSDKTGTCAVSIACNSGYTAFLEYLEGWTSPKTGKPFDWEANSLYYSTRKLKTHLNPLHMACISSNRAVVAFLLERKLVGINNKTHRGYTAMHLAVRFHNAEILSLLVEYGADIGAVDNLGQLPLHWAVAWGYLDAVEFLLSKGSPQTRNYLGKTPLTIAVDGKRLEMITLFENILGEKPADSHGALGLSAAADFFVAAVKRGDVNGCEMVLKNGLPIDGLLRGEGRTSRLTPLGVAVSHGAQEVVNLLLNRGATTADVFPFLIMPDEHDPWHGTVLDLAVIKFASEAILWRLLDRHLEEGENHLNNPPGLLWRAALHENILAINVLTRHLKANIKAYRKNCTTLECSDLVRAAINQRNSEGGSCLEVSCDEGNADMVEFLLANGADVHQPNDVGARPLHIAARSKAQNSDQIMKFLIAAGAAVNVRNIFGNDAISLCGRDPVNREILLSGDAPLSFSTFALQHRPSPFGDFISILDTDAFVLLARHGIDPTSDNGLGAIPAHAAMAQAKVASLLLNGDYGMTELASPRIDFAHPIESSWLGSAFRLYRRRIPEARFKRVLESPVFHGCTCLYWAAYVGSSQAIANILSAGIPADGKGGPEGTALMAACEGGNLQAVKVLVRHGAKLLFWDADREISAIDLARESAEVVRWLLVLRHTEQNKIQAAGAEVPGNRGAEEVPVRAWSGVTKREIWTAYHRRQNESLREYLIRLSQMKAELRGKPAPPLSRRSRIDQDWDRPKMITDGALHTSMDLKNNVEEWTRGYYNREEWWREYYSTEENDSGSESGSWE